MAPRALLALLVGLPLAAAAILPIEVAIFGRRVDPGPADAAIVLGAAVLDTRPFPVFEERVRHAVALYRAGIVGRLVMTGGRDPGDRLSEAEAARDWAIAHGVPADAILIETRSQTTRANLENSRELLRANGLNRVLLVSDPLHMRRAVAIAQHLGIDAYPSPTSTGRYVGWRLWTGFLMSESYYLASCRLRALC